MKILYVIPRLADAGTEKHLCMLAQGMQQEGIDVTVCCLFESNYDVPYGFTFVCLSRKNIYDVRILVDLYLLMVRSHFDVVHAYLFGFNYLAVVPAKIAGVKLIVTSRRELASWKKFHHRLLENIANIFTDKVIACSEAAKKFALETEKYVKGKITVIYNGVDTRKFYPREKSKKIMNEFFLTEADIIFGMVANFSAVKNHLLFLKSLALLKKHYACFKCLLIGEGYLRERIVQMISNLNLSREVFLTGNRSDLPELLSVMNFLILTSSSEGLPNALLEAMACRIPVVASNVGGIPEVIQNRQTGLLLSSLDSKVIVDSIMELVSDKSLSEHVGANGFQLVSQRFCLEKMTQAYKKVYEDAL
jgi:glycosyltransferase involved in cell wall biosynthesis